MVSAFSNNTMAKSKYNIGGKSIRSNKKTVRVTKTRVGTTKRSIEGVRDVLDMRARQYLMLLKNPCHGPLVGSVNPLNGAMISRYATEYSYTAGVVSDFIITLSPGDLLNNSGLGGAYSFSGAAGTNLTVAQVVPPGFSQLQSIAGSCKPIAACIDIRWGGTENNRAGLVGKFISSGKLLEYTDSPNAGATLSACFEDGRMPPDTTTIKWRPNATGDQMPIDPNSSFVIQTYVSGTKAQIGMVVPAMAVGATVFYRITIVYEWSPLRTGGQVVSPYTPSSTVPHSALLAEVDRDLGWLTRMETTAMNTYQAVDGAIKTGRRIYSYAKGAAEMIAAL